MWQILLQNNDDLKVPIYNLKTTFNKFNYSYTIRKIFYFLPFMFQ